MHYADYGYFQHSLADYQSNCKPLVAFQVFTGGFLPTLCLLDDSCTSHALHIGDETSWRAGTARMRENGG